MNFTMDLMNPGYGWITMRKLTLFLLLAFASFSTLRSGLAQDSSSDDSLAKNLLSSPGPTFQVDAKDFGKNWTIIAYGDTRFTDPANVTAANPRVRRWLVDQIATEHPGAPWVVRLGGFFSLLFLAEAETSPLSGLYRLDHPDFEPLTLLLSRVSAPWRRPDDAPLFEAVFG